MSPPMERKPWWNEKVDWLSRELLAWKRCQARSLPSTTQFIANWTQADDGTSSWSASAVATTWSLQRQPDVPVEVPAAPGAPLPGVGQNPGQTRLSRPKKCPCWESRGASALPATTLPTLVSPRSPPGAPRATAWFGSPPCGRASCVRACEVRARGTIASRSAR
eukprot:CAMPEP_0194553004 /NCGR_PEP_ID=MMETSP0253-20130528/97011_1 /TAXON_ID=2966 /ORGANISM="Noctiluca scintillans" /LENGTH=163 /DNA_ID=CAMNT_0039400479 /DNA_START=651 /DNA_END=1139 /DNA_ORIENTATION=+